MSHSYHQPPDSDAVFFDGCPECADRASSGIAGLLALDSSNLDRLWLRFVQREFGSGLSDFTSNEQVAFRTCYRLYVLLERIGFPAHRLRGGPSGWFQ